MNSYSSRYSDSNLLQPAATDGVYEENTLHTSHFLVLHSTYFNVARDRLKIFVRIALFTVSIIFLFILLIFIFVFIFRVGWFGKKCNVLSANEELGTFDRQQSSHRFVSPISSTTTRSQRPLRSSSRSPPATAGPRICMTSTSPTRL